MDLEIPGDELHLWCAFFDEIDDEALLREYRKLLNPSEREQEPRFYFAHDRRRYLVTRAMVRTVLSRYASVEPAEWEFATNEYGRPKIANAALESSRISFNLAHTHGLIILAIASGPEIGVDAENIAARAVSIEVADHFFAPAEVTALHALPKQRQQQRFFEYWTLKESYIKARGMGLSIPLDHFSFSFPTDLDIEIDIHRDQNDAPSRWRFWQFRIGADFLAALCEERAHRAAPRLVVRKVLPLVGEHALEYQLLRASSDTVLRPLEIRSSSYITRASTQQLER